MKKFYLYLFFGNFYLFSNSLEIKNEKFNVKNNPGIIKIKNTFYSKLNLFLTTFLEAKKIINFLEDFPFNKIDYVVINEKKYNVYYYLLYLYRNQPNCNISFYKNLFIFVCYFSFFFVLFQCCFFCFFIIGEEELFANPKKSETFLFLSSLNFLTFLCFFLIQLNIKQILSFYKGEDNRIYFLFFFFFFYLITIFFSSFKSFLNIKNYTNQIKAREGDIINESALGFKFFLEYFYEHFSQTNLFKKKLRIYRNLFYKTHYHYIEKFSTLVIMFIINITNYLLQKSKKDFLKSLLKKLNNINIIEYKNEKYIELNSSLMYFL